MPPRAPAGGKAAPHCSTPFTLKEGLKIHGNPLFSPKSSEYQRDREEKRRGHVGGTSLHRRARVRLLGLVSRAQALLFMRSASPSRRTSAAGHQQLHPNSTAVSMLGGGMQGPPWPPPILTPPPSPTHAGEHMHTHTCTHKHKVSKANVFFFCN